MKIQSKFKDYYDYVAHIYGGGDPKVIYARAPLTQFNDQRLRLPLVVDHRVDYRLPDMVYGPRRFFDYSFSVLVIMDRPFLLYKKLEPDSEYKIYDFEINPLNLSARARYLDLTKRYPNGSSSKNILELTKKVGTPVYVIEHSSYTGKTSIQSEIPNLGKLGVASFYPAEQLYQDLAYFIGNIMSTSPDTVPPVVIDNLTRLQQHGFDKKVSFRHRK